MLETKNFAPKELALLAAAVLAVPIGAGIGLMVHWWAGLISMVVIFSGAYLLTLFIIRQFLYRKIKLIYKYIYRTKASKRQATYDKYILPQKTLEEVRQDVEDWGRGQQEELDTLKRTETFRKEFLQNLSHEFKTPVFAIQGYIHTLLEGAKDDAEINERFLQKASKNVDRLVNLIQDLDEISRLERGEITIHRTEFVIQDAIREVYESLSLKAEQAGISLLIKRGCEAPLAVWADKKKIQQVITNVVDNAIKYGHSGGHTIASMYSTDGRNILVEITDNGMGIQEAQLPRVFERFYRTETGRSRDVTGSGLGLAICKHILEAHGQEIHVRSTEGVGTSVGFTLPQPKAKKAGFRL